MIEEAVAVAELEVTLGGRQVLDRVRIRAGSGELVFIAGRNGSGKSTVFRAIMGRLLSSGGEVAVRGQVGYHEQTPVYMPDMTVVENLRSFNKLFRTQWSPARMDQFIEELGLSHAERSNASSLSGGEKQRLALGITLMRDKDIYLFDEAESAMDPAGRRFYFDMLKRLSQEGKTVLWISHHIRDSLAVADRGYFMHGGKAYSFDVSQVRSSVQDYSEDAFADYCEEQVVNSQWEC
ncbi:hypothetical protein DNH61_05825 [Paenibacillus sambharensis]|uniref:ABC transporter domain-containing protein n=1 Tax=Paenibacillus sambharensis TaxID=1803190 RepID=A0A2W1LPC6_9BACL|nr:ABC transporter ATP-binding protein [Paenibacillus sambharensis]PZD96715.1 hypothetical protein DNH61_05825 [Paenibacillus sambharensis]